MKKFVIEAFAFVVALFLLACTDYVSKMEDEHENLVRNQGFDCIPRSAKALKKESQLPRYVNALTSSGSITLDVVIRDFQPDHPDFENFSEESVNHLNEIYNYRSTTGAAMNMFGYGDVWYANSALHNTCGNMNAFEKYGFGVAIGVDGLPMKANTSLPHYLQVTSAGSVLEYGECSQKIKDGVTGQDVILRGYENAKDDVGGYKCPSGNTNWANPVIYTPDMVNPYLLFTKMDGDKFDMLDGVVIQKQNNYCDNQFFEQWFTDVPGQNKRVNTTMDIPKDPASKYYIYDYNYSNGSFFPLDSINPITQEWVMNKPCNSIECDQYEPQTLSIFCPPYNHQYANNQTDFLGQNTSELCKEWLNQGGPRAVNSNSSGHSAAWMAAANFSASGNKLGLQHLRNYNFTMMGYASFKYKAANQIPTPETFEFVADDDMWIFVDGVLVVDLGGTHLPAPGKVNIQTLAVNNHGCHAGEPLASYSNCVGSSDATGWADDTWHHLHFFHAERQSDASNFYIRTSLAELAPSRNGSPIISDVISKVDQNGVAHNSMYMNIPLADSSVVAINNSNVPSMVVLREVTDASGVKQTVFYGFYVTSMTGPIDKGASGQMYQFEGVVMDLQGNVIDGGLLSDDRIAFNVPYSQGLDDDGNGGNYTSAEWAQLMAWSQKMNFYVAAAISSGKHVDGFDERENWSKISYSSAVDGPVYCDE